MATFLSNRARVAGLVLILLGLLVNPWVAGIYLPGDGRVDAPLLRAALTVFATLLLLSGLLVATGLARRIPSMVWQLAATAMLCMIGLGAAEIALRARLATPARNQAPLALWRENAFGTGSYRLRTNLDVRTEIEGTPMRIVTNEHGMAWTSVSIDKGSGVERVAFIGDSFTFGCCVADVEQSFVGIFASELDESGIETLNFGVSGYGLADMRLILREEVARFRPDYVILPFFTGNDFRDTHLGERKYLLRGSVTEWDSTVLASRVPPEHLQLQGWPARLGRLVEPLQIYQVARRAIVGEGTSEPPGGMFPPSDLFMSYTFWSRTEYPEVARTAVTTTLAMLDSIDAIARDSGIKLLVVAVPYYAQVYSRTERGDGWDVELPQRWVAEHAERRGIPYFDLLPAMRAHVAQSRVPLYWERDPHFNAAGHRLAGELIASFFRKQMTGGETSSAIARHSSP